jgi:hypothetical protein
MAEHAAEQFALGLDYLHSAMPRRDVYVTSAPPDACNCVFDSNHSSFPSITCFLGEPLIIVALYSLPQSKLLVTAYLDFFLRLDACVRSCT